MKGCSKSSIALPKQGIFWVIDNRVISFADTVDPHDFIEFGAWNHRDAWRHIKSDYSVNGREVGYDHFPRGRVIVNPTFDDDDSINGYFCGIYADPCIIDDESVRRQIEDQFNLYHASCIVSYEGDYTTDNTHYTCYRCRSDP